ncbi:MAG: hypothetical protein AB1567_05905 [bacterium]
MNRERRKIIGNIFGDAAKYALTIGVIGNVLSGEFAFLSTLIIGISFIIFAVIAYCVTPKDKKE